MKFNFFIFLTLILTTIIAGKIVLAVGFSPTSLIFNLNPGEKECQMITISSESETISVSDKWAENKDVEWKVSLFDKDASYHNIDISYDELLENENQVEVCLSGENLGEYHGVALLTEEQEGNSIIQVGVWLKVIITEKQEETITSGGGSSGGGGASTTGAATNTNTNIQQNQIENTNLAPEQPELQKGEEEQAENSGITGAVIGGKANMIGAVVLIAVIIAIGLIIYRRKRWKKFGY